MLVTVKDLLGLMEGRYSGGVAARYVDCEGKSVVEVTCNQMAEDIKRAATMFCSIKGDGPLHVGILAKNHYEYLVNLFGVIAAGAVVVPLNYEKSEAEIRYEITHADVNYIIVDKDCGNKFESLLAELELELCDINKWQESIVDESCLTSDCESLALILFTSGTTGVSKGVMMNQKAMFASANMMVSSTKDVKNAPSSHFSAYPYYHISGISVAIVMLAQGTTMHMCDAIKYIYRDLRMLSGDYAGLAPSIINMICKELKKGKNRLGTIKMVVSSSAALDLEGVKTFSENGIYLLQSYGMTEVCGGISLNASGIVESVGKPSAGVEVEIRDGEICVRSASMMMGYYKEPETTAEVLKDGWLYTGDLGYIKDDLLYITGRKKNRIVLSNGENIVPEEIEKEIEKIDVVIESIVLGRDDKLITMVYAENGNEDLIEQEIDAINKTLPMYKHIVEIEYVDVPFERTSTGKIKRLSYQ